MVPTITCQIVGFTEGLLRDGAVLMIATALTISWLSVVVSNRSIHLAFLPYTSPHKFSISYCRSISPMRVHLPFYMVLAVMKKLGDLKMETRLWFNLKNLFFSLSSEKLIFFLISLSLVYVVVPNFQDRLFQTSSIISNSCSQHLFKFILLQLRIAPIRFIKELSCSRRWTVSFISHFLYVYSFYFPSVFVECCTGHRWPVAR